MLPPESALTLTGKIIGEAYHKLALTDGKYVYMRWR